MEKKENKEVCSVCGKEGKNQYNGPNPTCSRECFNISFWEEKVRLANDFTVVVDGDRYQMRKVNKGAAFQGFGGAGHFIEFLDGRKYLCQNLWHQGTVPEEFKDRIPNNAIFHSVNDVDPLEYPLY